jgi:hypothetical protein
VTIEVRSGSGATSTQIFSSVISVTGLGYATPVVIPLNVPLPAAGTYMINLLAWSGSITGMAYQSSGVSYPYNSPNVSVFTGLWGASGYVQSSTTYFYFYNPTFTVGSSCESPRMPVVATIKTIPTVALANDTTICPGVSYTFNAGNPGAAYAWSTGATTQSITTNAAGTYSVSVTSTNGCFKSDTINVTPGIVPVNNLSAITNLCAGEMATLNAGNSGSSFIWTPGNATTQTINVNTAGNYSVVIKSTTGCQITSTTNLIIRPLPVPSLGNDTSICDGAQITLNAGNPGYTFSWNTGATTQTINVTDSGTYSVVTASPYNCILEEDKHIAYLPSPRVEGFNFIPLFYEELGKVRFSPLNPTNVNSYEWNFGDGTPTSVQVNPEHNYASGGNYIVTLKVFNGCGDFEISLPINVNLTTGIIKLNSEAADVVLYPNPSRDYIIIENKSDNLEMQEVAVFNTLGAMVYTHRADNGKNHKLNVNTLASGLYSIRILTDKGFVIRKFEVIK